MHGSVQLQASQFEIFWEYLYICVIQKQKTVCNGQEDITFPLLGALITLWHSWIQWIYRRRGGVDDWCKAQTVIADCDRTDPGSIPVWAMIACWNKML